MMFRVIPYAAINYAAHETLSRVRASPPGTLLLRRTARRLSLFESAQPPRLAVDSSPLLCAPPFLCVKWLTPHGDAVTGAAGHRGPLLKFLTGALTGMTSTICTYPVDVARARMAVAPKGVTNTLGAAFREMAADPRRWKAFYAGLTPTLAGIIPYSGTTWATYETLKERMLRARGEDPDSGELPTHLNALCGGFAGVVGQTVSYPFDVVRRRMQTLVLAPAGVGVASRVLAPSMGAVFADLIRTEGLHGMYKGLSVNYFKAPIAMGISFSMYARVKQALEDAAHAWDQANWEAEQLQLQEQQQGQKRRKDGAGGGRVGHRRRAGRTGVATASITAAAASAGLPPARSWSTRH